MVNNVAFRIPHFTTVWNFLKLRLWFYGEIFCDYMDTTAVGLDYTTFTADNVSWYKQNYSFIGQQRGWNKEKKSNYNLSIILRLFEIGAYQKSWQSWLLPASLSTADRFLLSAQRLLCLCVGVVSKWLDGSSFFPRSINASHTVFLRKFRYLQK